MSSPTTHPHSLNTKRDYLNPKKDIRLISKNSNQNKSNPKPKTAAFKSIKPTINQSTRNTLNPEFDELLRELINKTSAHESKFRNEVAKYQTISTRLQQGYPKYDHYNQSLQKLHGSVNQYLNKSVKDLSGENEKPKKLLRQEEEYNKFLTNNFTTFAINSPKLESIVIYSANPDIQVESHQINSFNITEETLDQISLNILPLYPPLNQNTSNIPQFPIQNSQNVNLTMSMYANDYIANPTNATSMYFDANNGDGGFDSPSIGETPSEILGTTSQPSTNSPQGLDNIQYNNDDSTYNNLFASNLLLSLNSDSDIPMSLFTDDFSIFTPQSTDTSIWQPTTSLPLISTNMFSPGNHAQSNPPLSSYESYSNMKDLNLNPSSSYGPPMMENFSQSQNAMNSLTSADENIVLQNYLLDLLIRNKNSFEDTSNTVNPTSQSNFSRQRALEVYRQDLQDLIDIIDRRKFSNNHDISHRDFLQNTENLRWHLGNEQLLDRSRAIINPVPQSTAHIYPNDNAIYYDSNQHPTRTESHFRDEPVNAFRSRQRYWLKNGPISSLNSVKTRNLHRKSRVSTFPLETGPIFNTEAPLLLNSKRHNNAILVRSILLEELSRRYFDGLHKYRTKASHK